MALASTGMERDIASGTAAGRLEEPPLGSASRWPTGRLRLRRLDGGHRPSFAVDVRQGLTSSPKALPPKYFYDELGSLLFAAITALPEYYVFRAEMEILKARAAEIAAWLPGPVRIVELGSGDARKTRLLIDALLARQGSLDYLPIDVSASALEHSSEALLSSYPNLRVTSWVADYRDALRAIRDEGRGTGRARYRHTLVLFLGSTIGNLEPADRKELLHDIGEALQPGDAFLLGVDLTKPEAVLMPAYDDPLGVTAAFNLNLLARINRELGGDFDLGSFRHRARYDAGSRRIEMHLESRLSQTVHIRELGLDVGFQEGETIHSENSYKFEPSQMAELAADAGLELRRTWTDRDRRFASNLLIRL